VKTRLLSTRTTRLFRLAILPLSAGGSASARNAPIFVTGSPAPGGLGSIGTLSTLSSLAVGGDVTAEMQITIVGSANKFGVLRGNETGSVLIARTGIDYGTGSLVEVAGGGINMTGGMTLALEPGAKPYGVYRATDSVVSPVVISTVAQPIAPAPGGGSFSFVDSSVISNGGTIAFRGTRVGDVGSETGIWRNNSDGTSVLIAAKGTNNVPGIGTPTFSFFGQPAINTFGSVAFSAVTTNFEGIFISGRTNPSDLICVVQSGTAAPNGAGTFDAKLSDAMISDRSIVAFYDTLSGATSGIWLAGPTTGGAITQVAIIGSSSGAGTFTSFNPPLETPAGYFAFWGSEKTSAGSLSHNGIWRGQEFTTGLTRIVAEGENPLGTGTISTVFGDPLLSDSGPVAYHAKIGTGTSLFISNGSQTFQISATGDSLLGSTVTNLALGSGIDRGGHNAINKYGQVGYQATLADGRQAIMLYTPELHWNTTNTGSFSFLNGFNWTFGIPPASVHDVFADPAGSVTLTASGGSVRSLNLTSTGTIFFNNDGGSVSKTPFNATNTLTIGTTSYTTWKNSAITSGSVDNNGTFTIQSDSLTTGAITGSNGYLAVGNSAGAVTLTADSIRQHTLSIDGSSHVILRPTNSTSVVNILSSSGGSVDFGNNAMIVDYTGSSPMVTISGNIIKGYNGGAWHGTWFTTTATGTGGDYGLGYGEANSILGPTGGTFQGENVDGTAILIKYTLYGDANLDGRVNALDFNALATNFGATTNRFWNRGNFNYDTIINTADFTILANHFGMTMPSAALGAVVPEPQMLVGISLAGMLLSRRRNRRAR